jgi:hypothetical protein
VLVEEGGEDLGGGLVEEARLVQYVEDGLTFLGGECAAGVRRGAGTAAGARWR